MDEADWDWVLISAGLELLGGDLDWAEKKESWTELWIVG